MINVFFQRNNADGTTDTFLEFETDDQERADDYCDIRNHNLAQAGIPSSVAFFFSV